MTWKSTAMLSGGTLLATWLASAPAVPGGSAPAPAPMPVPAATGAAAAIVGEADRLASGLRAAQAFREPARDLFRFAPAPSSLPPAAPLDPVLEPVLPPSAAPPAGPGFTLAGIAATSADDGVVRTAILSTPAGVLLVKEGDAAGATHHVSRITGDAVELTRDADGETLRLTF